MEQLGVNTSSATRDRRGLGQSQAKTRRECLRSCIPPASSRWRDAISRPNGNQTDPLDLSASIDANVCRPALFARSSVELTTLWVHTGASKPIHYLQSPVPIRCDMLDELVHHATLPVSHWYLDVSPSPSTVSRHLVVVVTTVLSTFYYTATD